MHLIICPRNYSSSRLRWTAPMTNSKAFWPMTRTKIYGATETTVIIWSTNTVKCRHTTLVWHSLVIKNLILMLQTPRNFYSTLQKPAPSAMTRSTTICRAAINWDRSKAKKSKAINLLKARAFFLIFFAAAITEFVETGNQINK